MRLSKRGEKQLWDAIFSFPIYTVFIGVMSVIIIPFIVMFGSVAEKTATSAAEFYAARGSADIASLLQILGTDSLFTMLCILAYLILVLVGFVVTIYSTIKNK